MILVVSQSTNTTLYEATVFVTWEDNAKQLTAFKIVKATPGGTYPNTLLEFKKVWSAKEQVVKGYNYYLTLEAADGGKNNVYEATVLEKAGENVKELLEFRLLGPA
ncbi:UNVERIFIED_CONTAM: Cysteine proteinase inhibitor 1 [Sesamum radiatum]|uniref:Cysteine proteinase inhibitor n=1 Tax=Sesamum radiatum TaxID=300843 RepID=A0AAW2UQY9_SESRA